MEDKQHLLEWIKERVAIEQETLIALEKDKDCFGNEYLEGKVSGMREVYYHILKVKFQE